MSIYNQRKSKTRLVASGIQLRSPHDWLTARRDWYSICYQPIAKLLLSQHHPHVILLGLWLHITEIFTFKHNHDHSLSKSIISQSPGLLGYLHSHCMTSRLNCWIAPMDINFTLSSSRNSLSESAKCLHVDRQAVWATLPWRRTYHNNGIEIRIGLSQLNKIKA